MTSERSSPPSGLPSGRLNSLPGETVETVAVEADVELAIRDALATFAADEIVAVRPQDEAGLVELRATSGAPQRSVNGVPVRLVVISGS